MSDGSCRHQFSIPGEWHTGLAQILQQHFQPGIVTGYQYATGMVASLALSEKVLAGEPGAVDRYIEFLSNGTSDYPVELLRKAGVDLTTSEPFELAIQAVNRAMDEIEQLIEKAGPTS